MNYSQDNEVPENQEVAQDSTPEFDGLGLA